MRALLAQEPVSPSQLLCMDVLAAQEAVIAHNNHAAPWQICTDTPGVCAWGLAAPAQLLLLWGSVTRKLYLYEQVVPRLEQRQQGAGDGCHAAGQH